MSPPCIPRPIGSVASVYTGLHCSIHWFVLVHTLEYTGTICWLASVQLHWIYTGPTAAYVQCIHCMVDPVYIQCINWSTLGIPLGKHKCAKNGAMSLKAITNGPMLVVNSVPTILICSMPKLQATLFANKKRKSMYNDICLLLTKNY